MMPVQEYNISSLLLNLFFLIGLSSAAICPDIGSIKYADVIPSRDPPFTPGTVLKIKCDKGYKGHGVPKLKCQKDGTWSDPPPICAVFECKRSKSKLEKGRKCGKTCKTDGDCGGQFKKCQCDDWCGRSCFNPDAKCPTLSHPENGYINGTVLSYGYRVKYGCVHGYALSGAATRKCRSDKKWSGEKPKCLPLGSCGQSGVEDKRNFFGKVVEGEDAKEGAWPWQALLFYNADYSVAQFYDRHMGFAGGTIIDNKWILTAAHAFDDILGIRKVVDWKKRFLVTLGMTIYPDQNEDIPDHVNIFEPLEVFRHQSYDALTYDYDVALIKVGKRLKPHGMKFVVDESAPEDIIEFSWYIRPICLPCIKIDPNSRTTDIWKNFDEKKCSEEVRTPTLATAKTRVIVTGFGWARKRGEDQMYKPEIMQQGLLSIQPDSVCVQTVRAQSEYGRYTDRMICAKSANKSLRTDACRGDSGGPIVKQIETEEKTTHWIQLGIVSWGFGCGGAEPGFYVNVPSVMLWISRIIGTDGKDVTCPDISAKFDGTVKSDSAPPYTVNTILKFSCKSGRLQGSSERTCMPDGKWSGTESVCRGVGRPKEVCPHPGVPSRGEIIGSNFEVGEIISFRCIGKLVIFGAAVQECLPGKVWNGGGAPPCVDPQYRDPSYEPNQRLKIFSSNVEQRKIRMDEAGNIGVYFIFDISQNVSPSSLMLKITFAKELVERLRQKDESRVKYGIIAFASTAYVVIDFHKHQTPEEVIENLSALQANVEKIRDTYTYRGRNILPAYLLLNSRTLSKSYQLDSDLSTKRHAFVLTAGDKFVQDELSGARKVIELLYVDNPPEFYCISALGDGLDSAARKYAKFVYVVDHYQMHTYVDLVTDVRVDYSVCGQAGDIGLKRTGAARGRALGGTDAPERTWPWHVAISGFEESVRAIFGKLLDGGTLISSQWILTAGQIFEHKVQFDGWEKEFVLAMGITKMPIHPSTMQSSIRIFAPEKIYVHDDIHNYNGTYIIGSYQNDIALIKIGGEYELSTDGRFLVYPASPAGSVEFSPYIRPACLPCSQDSCVSKILEKPDKFGNSLIKGFETPDEKCRIERDFLMGVDEPDGSAEVYLIGFGHNETMKYNEVSNAHLFRQDNLQQTVMQIVDSEKCREAVGIINKVRGIPEYQNIFTDEMFCTRGFIDPPSITRRGDSCQGDSGEPLMREVQDVTTKESCFVELGFVSWGFGCGDSTIIEGQTYYYPSFNTDVISFLPWIKKKMEEHKSPTSD